MSQPELPACGTPCGWSFLWPDSWPLTGSVQEGAAAEQAFRETEVTTCLLNFPLKSSVSLLLCSVGYKRVPKANPDAKGKAMTRLLDGEECKGHSAEEHVGGRDSWGHLWKIQFTLITF